jgi:hypothetical protein
MIVEALGLDPRVVRRVAHRTQQWGEALERDAIGEDLQNPPALRHDQEQKRRETASLFAIAGSYRLLLDVGEARYPLQRGAQHFNALGSPFAHPLAVCGDETQIVGAALQEDRQLSAPDRANVLLALGWLDQTGPGPVAADAHDALRSHLELAGPVAETPVGRLRVPMAAIAAVVAAADSAAHQEADLQPLVAAVHDVLIRIHDMTAAAMQDRYHWKNLLSGVLPVEPEAAALAAIAMAAAMRRGADDDVLGTLGREPAFVAPLLIGREIVRRSQ